MSIETFQRTAIESPWHYNHMPPNVVELKEYDFFQRFLNETIDGMEFKQCMYHEAICNCKLFYIRLPVGKEKPFGFGILEYWKEKRIVYFIFNPEEHARLAEERAIMFGGGD